MQAQQQPTFFQTTILTAPELACALAAAAHQDDAVLALFRHHGALSPSQCHSAYERTGKRAPLTSIRRSITVLTRAGALRKTDTQRPGVWNKPEHVWELVA